MGTGGGFGSLPTSEPWRLKMGDSKPEKKLTLSEFVIKEAEDTFRMFRDDLVKIKDAMTVREKKIEEIKAEQVVDYQRRLKVEGALSACQHLVTKYRAAWAAERDKKRAIRDRKQSKRKVQKTVNG